MQAPEMIGADVVEPVLPKRQISIKAAKADLDVPDPAVDDRAVIATSAVAGHCLHIIK